MTMTITTSTTSPQFEQAAVKAIGVLDAAKLQLQRMRADVHEFEEEQELMYLCSLALLAGQRGRHLVDEYLDEVNIAPDRDLAELLSSSHDQLIAQTSGLEPFVVLEFVSEVGALCRGVRRYVHDH
jgi:hypothetical protein